MKKSPYRMRKQNTKQEEEIDLYSSVWGDTEIDHCDTEVPNIYKNGEFPGKSRFLVSVENSDVEALGQRS